MDGDLEKTVAIVAVMLVCIAGLAAAAASGLLASGSRIALYVLANLILAFDVVDLVVRLWLKRLHGAAPCGPSVDLGLPEISNAERVAALSPYAVIASLHDEAGELDRFLKVLLPFKDVTWLIDDASGDTTLLRLRREDWNCVAGAINRKKPGALLQLLRTLPSEIQTVVVMDPDVRWTAPPGTERSTLERVISDLQRSGAAGCTPRIQASGGGWLEECQGLEYELACGLGRKSLRDLTCNSGVSVYRRSALEQALARHSLSVYAEDFENSLLLLAAGERIYYDDRLVVETRAKRTWNSLFSQRVGWAFGCARAVTERMPLFMGIARRSPLGAYQYVFYLGINGMLLLPLKLASIAVLAMSLLKGIDELLMTHWMTSRSWDEPLLFGLWYVKSIAILLLACLAALPRGERLRHLGTLPFYGVYALLQYLPTTIGYLNLAALRVLGRRLYADHYDAGPVLPRVIRSDLQPEAPPL
jgi:Glycosyl transferase family group 2